MLKQIKIDVTVSKANEELLQEMVDKFILELVNSDMEVETPNEFAIETLEDDIELVQHTATLGLTNTMSIQIRVTEGNSDELEYKYSDEEVWTKATIIEDFKDDESGDEYMAPAFKTTEGPVFFIDEFVKDNI